MSATPMPTRAPAAGVARRYVNPVIKDAATFLESTGERTAIEIELAPGGGNTPHRHRTYAEHFTVGEGRLTVVVDGAEHELAPGDEATAPMMSLHHFANPTGERTVFRVELRPGHAGFEKAIRVAYGLAADGRTNDKAIPRNPLHTALILAWSDMLVPGPLSVRPVLKLLVTLARILGVERALERRYPPQGADWSRWPPRTSPPESCRFARLDGEVRIATPTVQANRFGLAETHSGAWPRQPAGHDAHGAVADAERRAQHELDEEERRGELQREVLLLEEGIAERDRADDEQARCALHAGGGPHLVST